MAQALFSFLAVIDHALGEVIPLDKAAKLSYWHPVREEVGEFLADQVVHGSDTVAGRTFEVFRQILDRSNLLRSKPLRRRSQLNRIPDGADLFLIGCYAVFQLIQGVLQLLDQFAMKIFPASRRALSHQSGA